MEATTAADRSKLRLFFEPANVKVNQPRSIARMQPKSVRGRYETRLRFRKGNNPCSSREATACESPARKCRESDSGTSRVRFSGRHEFRNRLLRCILAAASRPNPEIPSHGVKQLGRWRYRPAASVSRDGCWGWCGFRSGIPPCSHALLQQL